MFYETLKVGPRSPTSLRDRVFRLRHAVYVGEMRLPLQGPAGYLADDYDDYSSNFLLTCGGQDVGTVRYTNASSGTLEVGEQCARWGRRVREMTSGYGLRVCEINRLMVRKEHRGGRAFFLLCLAFLQECRADGVEAVLLAAKEGALSGFYQLMGARCVCPDPSGYTVHGVELGKYTLHQVDLRSGQGDVLDLIKRGAGVSLSEEVR